MGKTLKPSPITINGIPMSGAEVPGFQKHLQKRLAEVDRAIKDAMVKEALRSGELKRGSADELRVRSSKTFAGRCCRCDKRSQRAMRLWLRLIGLHIPKSDETIKQVEGCIAKKCPAKAAKEARNATAAALREEDRSALEELAGTPAQLQSLW